MIVVAHSAHAVANACETGTNGWHTARVEGRSPSTLFCGRIISTALRQQRKKYVFVYRCAKKNAMGSNLGQIGFAGFDHNAHEGTLIAMQMLIALVGQAEKCDAQVDRVKHTARITLPTKAIR